MWPQAKKCLEPPNSRTLNEAFSPRAFRGSTALLTAWFWTSNLQNYERITLSFKITKFVRICYSSPRKLIKWPSHFCFCHLQSQQISRILHTELSYTCPNLDLRSWYKSFFFYIFLHFFYIFFTFFLLFFLHFFYFFLHFFFTFLHQNQSRILLSPYDTFQFIKKELFSTNLPNCVFSLANFPLVDSFIRLLINSKFTWIVLLTEPS